VLAGEAFGWMASPDFEHQPGAPLRLAAQSETCNVRGMATSALDEAGIPWTEVFVGGGIPTIGAAVSAGLAVAALARRVAPPGTVDMGPQLSLPSLPSRDVVLYSSLSDPKARNSLRALAAAMRASASRN
jgi:DNA-binding transcriptional LysR family regulator